MHFLTGAKRVRGTTMACAEHFGQIGPNGLKLENETTHFHHSRRRRMTMKGKHHNTSKRRDRDLRLLVRDLGHDAIPLLDAVARHERRVVQGIDVGVDRASLSKIYA